MKIKFLNLDEIVRFTGFTEKLEHSNLDVRRGNQFLDGKSFLGMVNVQFGLDYEITIITSDDNERELFNKYIKEWNERRKTA